MDKTDITENIVPDILTALGLLTRLPVEHQPDQHSFARSAWAFPVAGMAVGGIAAVVGWVLSWFGFGPSVQAGFILLAFVVLTGAMHEDGLADAADGLWGGWDVERRLEIMKDSRIGAYGVLALVFGLGLRWIALSAALAGGMPLIALMGIAAMSRVPMSVLMGYMPNARHGGLSASVGTPTPETVWIAAGIGAFLGLICFGFSVIWIILWAGLLVGVLAWIAAEKIGGQTGDILGASQQIAEIAILTALSAQFA